MKSIVQMPCTLFKEGMMRYNAVEVWLHGKGGLDMQKQWVRILLWILTAAMCVMIFAFSSQDGEESMATSGRIAEPIAHAITVIRQNPSPSFYDLVLGYVQAAVRKTAHFLEYAVLGSLVFLLHESYKTRYRVLPSWTLTACYAVGDEVHQWLGGSRTGMWQDVVLDAIGALAGILICRAVCRKKNRQQTKAV